jgi:predicted nucleic acid-binding protein
MAMADQRSVVVDAGPLIHLDELGCLDLLAGLSPLITPELVWNETRQHRPLLQLTHIPGLRTMAVDVVPSSRLAVFIDTLGLDTGETAALVMAERRGTRMFLTDDSAARFAAESLGLQVHGTVGILLRSIRRDLRSREEVLSILASIRECSTLHLGKSLLDEIVAKVVDG